MEALLEPFMRAMERLSQATPAIVFELVILSPGLSAGG